MAHRIMNVAWLLNRAGGHDVVEFVAVEDEAKVDDDAAYR